MRSSKLLKTGTAQADTGQTTPFTVPSYARDAIFYLDVTALAGTTRTIDLTLNAVDSAGASNTSNYAQFAGITQLTAVGLVTIYAGPGITGIADDVTAHVYKLNAPLPNLMNAVLTLGRGDGDEKYTYTLTVDWMS
jgi:hypothetical protein